MEHHLAREKLLLTDSEKEVKYLFNKTNEDLTSLRNRLDIALKIENERSTAKKSFCKLSTRSPKDSSVALANATMAYSSLVKPETNLNDRWRILSEEVGKAGAISNGAEALELLLTSERVYEDLEYALRGPTVGEDNNNEAKKIWNTSICVRAWDPRLTPQSEFRGICWDGKLTCLCQYFHPLHFSELAQQKDEIEQDILKTMEIEGVNKAVSELGGCCIIDFAWLGSGEVVIIELNPFDGVCLGTFPASTGLFLWEDEKDKRIMKGEDEFEFRIRESAMSETQLGSQGNRKWREIISGGKK